MPDNESLTEDIIIEGVGMFTPPPSPCGNSDCGWVELDLVHVEDCPES